MSNLSIVPKITGQGTDRYHFHMGIATPLSILGRKENQKLSITGSSFNSIQGMKRGTEEWSGTENQTLLLCCVVSCPKYSLKHSEIDTASASRICTASKTKVNSDISKKKDVFARAWSISVRRGSE
jgi:hypothetical protein